MSEAMITRAKAQDGFLGVESARDNQGFGITNSYWRDEASIKAWKCAMDHMTAQKLGRKIWYEDYNLRIGRIERAYDKASSNLK